MKRLLELLSAMRLGLSDGLEDGRNFAFGMTWTDDCDRNEWYDRGVNWGQRLARCVGR